MGVTIYLLSGMILQVYNLVTFQCWANFTLKIPYKQNSIDATHQDFCEIMGIIT